MKTESVESADLGHYKQFNERRRGHFLKYLHTLTLERQVGYTKPTRDSLATMSFCQQRKDIMLCGGEIAKAQVDVDVGFMTMRTAGPCRAPLDAIEWQEKRLPTYRWRTSRQLQI